MSGANQVMVMVDLPEGVDQERATQVAWSLGYAVRPRATGGLDLFHETKVNIAAFRAEIAKLTADEIDAVEDDGDEDGGDDTGVGE